MIVLLGIFGFWFSQLSSIPQGIIYDYSHKIPMFLTWIVRKLECTKCVCFWLGLFYTLNQYNLDSIFSALLLGGICSFIGMFISLIYKRLT